MVKAMTDIINVRLKKETKKRLEKIARVMDVSRSRVVQLILDRGSKTIEECEKYAETIGGDKEGIVEAMLFHQFESEIEEEDTDDISDETE